MGGSVATMSITKLCCHQEPSDLERKFKVIWRERTRKGVYGALVSIELAL